MHPFFLCRLMYSKNLFRLKNCRLLRFLNLPLAKIRCCQIFCAFADEKMCKSKKKTITYLTVTVFFFCISLTERRPSQKTSRHEKN